MIWPFPSNAPGVNIAIPDGCFYIVPTEFTIGLGNDLTIGLGAILTII